MLEIQNRRAYIKEVTHTTLVLELFICPFPIMLASFCSISIVILWYH
jgi:hypothetical protein